MGQELAIVVPLALGAAISPAVLTLQLLTLSRPTAPLARGWALAAGYVAVLLAETVVGLLLAAGTGGSDTPSETEAAVKLVAAVVLALLGVRSLRAPAKAAAEQPVENSRRLARYLALGAGLMVTNVTTTVLFLPAMHDIGTSGLEPAGAALAVLVAIAITALPAAGPPLAVTLLGKRAQPGLAALNGFATRHRRTIDAGICFGFAAFLAAVSLPTLH